VSGHLGGQLTATRPGASHLRY